MRLVHGCGLRLRRRSVRSRLLSTDPAAPDLAVASVDELRDFNQPHAPAALLKAALLCADVVSFEGGVGGGEDEMDEEEHQNAEEAEEGRPPAPLAEQLRRNLAPLLHHYHHHPSSSKPAGGGGEEEVASLSSSNRVVGLRVATSSLLPQGSGLGTSSILAGAVLCALGHATGRPYCAEGDEDKDNDSAEGRGVAGGGGGGGEEEEEGQKGGGHGEPRAQCAGADANNGWGWQDQGGLVGLGSPAKSALAPVLPLRVTVDSVPLTDAFRGSRGAARVDLHGAASARQAPPRRGPAR